MTLQNRKVNGNNFLETLSMKCRYSRVLLYKMEFFRYVSQSHSSSHLTLVFPLYLLSSRDTKFSLVSCLLPPLMNLSQLEQEFILFSLSFSISFLCFFLLFSFSLYLLMQTSRKLRRANSAKAKNTKTEQIMMKTSKAVAQAT